MASSDLKEASVESGRPCAMRLWPKIRLAAGALTFQFALGLSYTWGALAPFAARQTHWSSLQVAAAYSAVPLGYGAGILLGGRQADLRPVRRLIWAAFALLAVAFGAFVMWPGWGTFTFLYAGLGAGVGGGFAMAACIAAARIAFPRHVGSAGGALTATFASSALVLIPVVTSLAGRLGWMAGYRLVGSALLLATALVLALMPPLPRAPRTGASGPALSLVQLLSRRAVCLGLMMELLSTPFGSYSFVHISPRALGLGLTLSVGSAGVALAIAGNGVGRLSGGVATDYIRLEAVVAISLCCSLAASLLFWISGNALELLVGSVLAGAGFGAPAGIMPRLAARGAPDAPSTAFGLIFIGYAGGSFIGPLAGEPFGPLGAYGWLAIGTWPLAGLAVLMLTRLH